MMSSNNAKFDLFSIGMSLLDGSLQEFIHKKNTKKSTSIASKNRHILRIATPSTSSLWGYKEKVIYLKFQNVRVL